MLLQFACLIGCGNNQKPQELQLKPHIIKIAIEYQNLDIETPIRIDCENFNTYFNNNIKVKVIDDSVNINKLSNYINQTKNKGKKAPKIDVRFKMKIIYSDGKNKEICGNESAVEIGELDYLVDVDFSHYLESILK